MSFYGRLFTRKIYNASIIAALAIVASSYFLEAIFHGNSVIDRQHLGTASVLQFGLLAICMLVAWAASQRTGSLTSYRSLLAAAIVMRLLLIPVDPYLSNDIDRYLFDGKIAISGLDPYRVSHDDPELTSIRAQWQPPDEHASYVTLYPPAALSLFALAALAGPDGAFWLWKFLVTASGILTLFISHLVLKKNNQLRHLPLVALSPILIMETGVGAHLDSITALTVCVAIYFWQQNRALWCGFFIGLGTLLKLLPVVMLMPLFFAFQSPTRKLCLVASTGSTILMGYGTALLAGWLPIGSVGVFFEKWRFGSPLSKVYDSSLLSYSSGLDYVLIAAVLAFLATLILTFLLIRPLSGYKEPQCSDEKNERHRQVIHAIQFVLIVPLLLSPVIFPWYLAPLIPLLAFSPNLFLLLWTVTLPLTYEVLGRFASENIWQPADWPITVIAAGMVASAIVFVFHRRPPTEQQ